MILIYRHKHIYSVLRRMCAQKRLFINTVFAHKHKEGYLLSHQQETYKFLNFGSLHNSEPLTYFHNKKP